MSAFVALKNSVDEHAVKIGEHTVTLASHETRISACETFDETQRQFFRNVKNHVTKWGMAIFGAIMATGLLDNKAAHVVGAFIHGLWGQP